MREEGGDPMDLILWKTISAMLQPLWLLELRKSSLQNVYIPVTIRLQQTSNRSGASLRGHWEQGWRKVD